MCGSLPEFNIILTKNNLILVGTFIRYQRETFGWMFSPVMKTKTFSLDLIVSVAKLIPKGEGDLPREGKGEIGDERKKKIGVLWFINFKIHIERISSGLF